MREVTSDMLPDASETQPVVSEDVQTPVPEAPVLTEPEPKPETGSKTAPRHLYGALDEERRKRKAAEEKAKELEAQLQSLESVVPEESQEGDVSALHQEILELKKANVFRDNPELVDKKDEFEEFLGEHPEYPLESAAKIFKAEKGLYSPNPRPGLERPTSGPKTPPSTSLTPEQIKDLRENHPRRFTELLRSGSIKSSDINW